MISMQLLGAVAVALLIAIAAGLFVSRNIAGRARRVEQTVKSLADSDASWLADALEAMSNQDLTSDVQPGTAALPDLGHDEIGQTAAATNRLREKIGATIASYGRARVGLQDVVRQMQTAAADVAATSEQLEAVGNLTGAAVQQVSQAVQSVAVGAQATSRNAQQTNAAVGQLGQVIDGIARGASDQAQQVQAASTTATQMAAGVEEVAANAQSVAAASQQTRVSAQHGADAVRETVAGMSEIKTVVTQAATNAQELGKRPEDRRGCRDDRRHRRPDQPAGAERRHRSGPRWRTRQRFCRRRRRGQKAGRAFLA